MKNTRTTEAFKAFYDHYLSGDQHNNPALIGKWGEDPSRFETQIMCRKMGNAIPDSNKYEQDGEIFGPVRWPYDAKGTYGDPHYSNPPIQFIPVNRVKAIGTTWWDWKNKHSVGLGFDFDSLIDHAEGVGVSQGEIEKLDNIDVPWLEVVRSTRGNGRHVYIWFQDPFPVTANHDEHSALARAFIPLIAEHTNLDIDSNVDCSGMVMWIHHIATTKENQGYSLVKPATQILTAEHVPPNWRDHLEVVSGSRTKVRVQGWTADGTPTEGDELDEMTQAHAKVKLDETHLAILEDLENTGHTSLWVHDHHLWQGHTAGLKQVYDEWKEHGKPMKGLFDTNSMDSDPGKPNCFMRPKPDGAWDVYRFGEGTEECPLWDMQGKFTHTTYNYPPTLKQVCLAAGGYEGPSEKDGYLFDEQCELESALEMLGSKLELPPRADGRQLSLHAGEFDKIILVIAKERSDDKKDFPYFVKTSRGWERWIKDAIKTSDAEQSNQEIWSELDGKIRALKLSGVAGSEFDSWVVFDGDEKWTAHPKDNVTAFLSSLGFKKNASAIIGDAVYRAWELVNEPFQPEYPGGRKWNRDAAQFVYAPVVLQEGEVLSHPTWTRVMEHCGYDLNQYIPELPWCKDWGILTGGDYLTAWVACMFQNPFGKLPYLFMYGPQNSGKSSFHEAISLLLTKGVAKADRALTSEQGYNGELMDAVLAVIDEVDISRAGMSVYNKIKEWVTGVTISIHAKYRPVQDVRNTLHFVQMSNTRNSLPVYAGDTRITAINVPCLEEEIPRDKLHSLLKQEAPHFMRTLLDYDVPEASGRLMLPVIETAGKAEAADSNRNELEQFVEENCFEVPGHAIKLSDLKDKFHATLEDYQIQDWRLGYIKNVMSESYLVGRSPKLNQTIVGNLTFNKDAQPCAPYVKSGSNIMKEGE